MPQDDWELEISTVRVRPDRCPATQHTRPLIWLGLGPESVGQSIASQRERVLENPAFEGGFAPRLHHKRGTGWVRKGH